MIAVGGLVMAHGDDDGLVLPPRLAPAHVVIMPILFKAENPEQVLEYCSNLRDELQSRTYDGRRIEVELDERDAASTSRAASRGLTRGKT